MKSILLNDSYFQVDKKVTTGSSRILLPSCRSRSRISHWYSWPHKVRNHGEEAGQLQCVHAVMYRKPSCAVTQVDCFRWQTVVTGYYRTASCGCMCLNVMQVS